jgi:hypothetical protein
MYDNTYDPYTYHSTTTLSSSDAAGIFLAMMGFVAIVVIISYVVYAIFLGMIFKKAGIESWKAWVPVYNTWLLLEMGEQPGWWSILAFIPFVNIVAAVFMYIAMYHVGRVCTSCHLPPYRMVDLACRRQNSCVEACR